MMKSTLIALSLIVTGAVASAAQQPGAPKRAVPAHGTAAPRTVTVKVKADAANPSGPEARRSSPRTVTVKVKADATVIGPSFVLGEIAEITGADKALVERLALVPVGVSPLPGVARTLCPGDITVRLRAARLESKQVTVSAPAAIRVTRAATEARSDDVTKAAVKAARDAITDIPDATFEVLPLAEKIVLPTGKLTVEAGPYRGKPENGMIYVPVCLSVNGTAVETVDIGLKVHRKATVVIPNRQIEPHEVLAAEDVSVTVMDLPSGLTTAPSRLEQVVGKRSLRRLQMGMPFAANALETPPAVNANDRVNIEFVYGPIRITAAGLAREAGPLGGTIRVYAVETRRELQAVILNAHTVRIEDNGGAQ